MFMAICKEAVTLLEQPSLRDLDLADLADLVKELSQLGATLANYEKQ